MMRCLRRGTVDSSSENDSVVARPSDDFDEPTQNNSKSTKDNCSLHDFKTHFEVDRYLSFCTANTISSSLFYHLVWGHETQPTYSNYPKYEPHMEQEAACKLFRKVHWSQSIPAGRPFLNIPEHIAQLKALELFLKVQRLHSKSS
jgi:hypothetical protein